jgi:dTDP-4-amino-4,6-dideoxygalactose transaminase
MRRAMRSRYRELFAAVDGVDVFGGLDDDEDNVWLTSIVVDSDVTGWTSADLSAALLEDNIESRPLWKPMHRQPIFADARAIANGNSERLFANGLTLPSGSALRQPEIDRVFSKLGLFVGARS